MTSFSDDFNRADGGLGANWENVGENGQGLRIASNEIHNGIDGGVLSFSRVAPSAADFEDDQECEITVTAIGNFDYVGIAVRLDGLGNGYFIHADAVERASNTIYRSHTNGAGATDLGGGGLPLIGVGDTLKLKAEGNIITAYVNDVQQIQVEDDTYSSGQPGVHYKEDNVDASRMDNFSALAAAVGGAGDLGLTDLLWRRFG